jgi:hypothetical protein
MDQLLSFQYLLQGEEPDGWMDTIGEGYGDGRKQMNKE